MITLFNVASDATKLNLTVDESEGAIKYGQ